MYLYSSFQSLERVDFKWGDSQISIPIPQATQEQYSYYFVYCFLVLPFTTQYPSTYLFHYFLMKTCINFLDANSDWRPTQLRFFFL